MSELEVGAEYYWPDNLSTVMLQDHSGNIIKLDSSEVTLLLPSGARIPYQYGFTVFKKGCRVIVKSADPILLEMTEMLHSDLMADINNTHSVKQKFDEAFEAMGRSVSDKEVSYLMTIESIRNAQSSERILSLMSTYVNGLNKDLARIEVLDSYVNIKTACGIILTTLFNADIATLCLNLYDRKMIKVRLTLVGEPQLIINGIDAYEYIERLNEVYGAGEPVSRLCKFVPAERVYSVQRLLPDNWVELSDEALGNLVHEALQLL